MVTVQPKKILHSLRFFVLRTIASLIFIPTILLLCTVSIIKPLALHNAGDRRNAVPCAALGCMKFTLVFLTLFFQRCNLHSDPTSFPVCSATPRFQLRFRPCELWRSPASGWRPAAPSVCAVCISCNPSCSRHWSICLECPSPTALSSTSQRVPIRAYYVHARTAWPRHNAGSYKTESGNGSESPADSHRWPPRTARCSPYTARNTIRCWCTTASVMWQICSMKNQIHVLFGSSFAGNSNSSHSKSRTRRKIETVGSDKISAGVHFERCTPDFSVLFVNPVEFFIFLCYNYYGFLYLWVRRLLW